MLISPQLQNNFYQEVKHPKPASIPACHPNQQPGLLLEGNMAFLSGAMQGFYRAGCSMQVFLCHRISQHPSVKDSFVPKQMMRYHSQ